MKKLFYILVSLFCFSNSTCFAQVNLVANPSFELYDTCPYAFNQLNFALFWYKPTLGPSAYLNQCGAYGVGVPLNLWSYQYARTGVAYAGIDCYETDPSSGLAERCYLQTQLNDTLIGGKVYCVSFYVNLTNGGIQYNPNSNLIAVDKIGLYFSTIPIQLNNTSLLPVTPQILSTPGIFLNDTVNWMQISGIYTALGGEKYITIGNFSDDANTDTMYLINNHALHNKALYNIDDISVTACNVGVGELTIDNGELIIYPNPTTSQLIIDNGKLKIKEVKIYNVLGECLNHELTTNNHQLIIDISSFSKGVYFVEVQTEKGIIRKKFVKE